MKDKKNILVISSYLPPKNDIAAMRVGGLCKYLSQRGWNVIALTTDHPFSTNTSYEIVTAESPPTLITKVIEEYKSESDYSNPQEVGTRDDGGTLSKRESVENILRSIVHFVRDEIDHFPDGQRLWLNNAVEVGNKIIAEKEISCIISSSDPFTCHRIASRLSNTHSIPWIADYRDPWSQNPYKDTSFARQFFERRMERKTIDSASEIVTVSEPIADMISNLHNREVKTILNGYDKSQHPDRSLRDTFTIMYPGQFYKGRRNPEMLFSAVSKLLEQGISKENISIEFYGYTKTWILDMAKDYAIADCVKAIEPVDKSVILKRESESHCLLSLHWDDSRSEGYYTGKIFEYLGAERPIAAITPPDCVEELLDESKSGKAFYNDVELSEWLYTQYRHFQKTGDVIYEINEPSLTSYSQQRLAKKYEELILENIP
jgi:hypothetical protein